MYLQDVRLDHRFEGWGDLREFKWWRAPELKVKLGFSTFVNVHYRFFALADTHAGHRVDGLGNILVCLALAAGTIADRSDDEFTGVLGNAAEVGSLRLGLA